jgi:uncharacterized membrane protein
MRTQIAFAGIGLLSIAVGVPLASRRVGPNRWYGLRIRATLTDEHVWYEANAATGRDLILLGSVLLVAALVLPGLVAPPAYLAICGGVFVAGSIASTARGCRLARRLQAARGGAPRPGPQPEPS